MRKDEVISVMKGRKGREDFHEEHGRRTENVGVNDIATIFIPHFNAPSFLKNPALKLQGIWSSIQPQISPVKRNTLIILSMPAFKN